MMRRGEAAWAPEEASHFFDAFHEYGQDWAKVAEAMGSGRGADSCEALFRKQQAYLSIPKMLQSAQAFAALVENAQKEEVSVEPSSRSQGGSGVGQEAAASGGAAASGLKRDHGEDDEEGIEEDDDEEDGGGRHARHTPKRGDFASPGGRQASGRRTPVSGVKRSRGGGGGGGGGRREEDIYQYYDEGAEALTESARKRRVARQRLDFAPQGGGRRQHDADEAKGIDALLALAVAGEESVMGMEEEEEEGVQQQAPGHKKAAGKPRARRAAATDADWEEEPADAGAMDNEDEDEDFSPPPRRTPYSTPAKAGRLPRLGSAHATPRRSGSRGVAASGLPASSPGLGLRGLSPYLMGGLEGGDMLDLGLADLGYITSPGFPHFPPGFVPSPQNPMPRLRRRKSAPERMQPQALVASPVKTLFTRRSSLAGGPSLMTSFGYTSGGGEDGGDGSTPADAAGAGAAAPQTAAEAQLRHCLQQPCTQRWASAEFFYSALDRPFFMFNPLSGLLAQLGLGEEARLTRREWSLVRSGLGTPRRLSLKFLKEERVRLERWRDGCRQQYQVGAAAVAAPQVADHLPLPLGVGQRVLARHPGTRQLHDGSVLTVAHNCYRVQFDRQELGVELVRDTDVMPAEPAENLPPALLAARSHLLNGRQIINGQPLRPPAPRNPSLALATPVVAAAAAAGAAAGTPLVPRAALTPALMPASMADGAAPGSGGAEQPQQQQQQQQARVADAKALAELVVGLDKKEALLLQLRGMNDEAAAGVHADASGAAAPQFVNAYANVVLQLKDVNDRVQDKLEQLDRPGGGGRDQVASAAATGTAGTALQCQQLGVNLATDAALQRQLVAQTPEALASVALEQARSIIAACRGKLAQSAAAEPAAAASTAAAAEPAAAPTPLDAASQAVPADEVASQQQQQQQQKEQEKERQWVASPAASMDWNSSEGRRLGGLIEGCVHSLVLLLQGSQSAGSLPAATLSVALDQALQAAQPGSAANQWLFHEIHEAVKGLKLHISAAS